MDTSPATTLAAMRRLLLGVLTFGLAGTTADLLLIGHYEDAWQLIPFAVIALAVLTTAALAWGQSRHRGLALLLFRTVMVLLIAAGAAGSVLHYRANREFKLEMDPTLGGFALFSSVMRATAPPAMAPGTLALLGLLGLTASYRTGSESRSEPRQP